jgi:hypothetical protein
LPPNLLPELELRNDFPAELLLLWLDLPAERLGLDFPLIFFSLSKYSLYTQYDLWCALLGSEVPSIA